ncbi:MAG: hypothetical protein ABL984_16055 [Pyrinomonadaceae bacterium]
MKFTRVLFLILLLAASSLAQFPTTSILDNFNRANENPLGGGWSAGPFWNGDGLHQIISNQVTAASSGFRDAVWNTNFGVDQEVYITIPTVSTLTSIGLYCRGTGENSPGFTNGYIIADFTRASGATKIDTTNTPDLATGTVSGGILDGDSIGLSCVGTAIKVYHKPSAGAWTQIISATTSDQNVSGKLAFTTDSAAAFRVDDFGGGDVSGGAAPRRVMNISK